MWKKCIICWHRAPYTAKKNTRMCKTFGKLAFTWRSTCKTSKRMWINLLISDFYLYKKANYVQKLTPQTFITHSPTMSPDSVAHLGMARLIVAHLGVAPLRMPPAFGRARTGFSAWKTTPETGWMKPPGSGWCKMPPSYPHQRAIWRSFQRNWPPASVPSGWWWSPSDAEWRC